MKRNDDNQNRPYGNFTTAFGIAALLLLAANARAQTYSVLHDFAGGTMGAGPAAGLVQGSDGFLYGTTRVGGTLNSGTVFKINTNGSGFTVLHQFTGADGSNPGAALVLGGDVLYGTTPYSSGAFGGTLFKLNTDGSGFVVLKQYNHTLDGAVPSGGLVLAGDTLYGTTEYTTVSTGYGAGYGTVFKVNTNGNNYTVLHTFTGADGAGPCGTLLLWEGTLYGPTENGGAYMPGTSCGTVFKVNTDGSGFASLQSFLITNGIAPLGGLALSGTGLYGTTLRGGPRFGGGPGPGNGTLFKLNSDGSGFATLRTFSGDEGAWLYGGLVPVGSALYGTAGFTSRPGLAPIGCGTIFRVSADGNAFSVVKRFCGTDGETPQAGLLLSGMTMYGTTFSGGLSSNGVIFAISFAPPTLLRPLETQTAEAGSTVTFRARTGGSQPLIYQWLFNGTNVLALGTNSVLQLANVQLSHAGTYTLVVSNDFGTSTSAPAMLSVIPAVERRSVPALTLNGQTGISLHLENRSALDRSGNWQPLDTVTLTNPPQWYFDLISPQASQGFYRAWQSEPLVPLPALDVHVVPAINLSGTPGSSVRLDYINQYGPVDAWVTLATIQLNEPSQLYFDTSVIGQPARLYRIVALP